MMYRPTARSSEVIELKVSRILTMIGELVPSDERAKQWAGRTRERFEEALLSLQKLFWRRYNGLRSTVREILIAFGRGVGMAQRYGVNGVSQRGPCCRADPPMPTAFSCESLPSNGRREWTGPDVSRYQRLRAERIARGGTQEQFAADLRVSAAYIWFDREWPTHSR